MHRIVLLIVLAAYVGCSSSGPVDPCPREGTVLADVRDMERDAEGISYAVFGPNPDHVPDFDRATGVLSLAKQVWARATTTCPNLPTESIAAVDSSLATLEVSLAARDQRASAYAANDIHLQMAPLFAYFNPGTPLEVVRMDAIFLRVGIDAWLANWTDFDANVSSLVTDWSTLRGTADGKVPTCNRVAGTQSVVGDLDQSLAALGAASTAKDVATAERESDAGLLEVDILELLFDCPVGTEPPGVGLGSACVTDADCDGGLVCNTEIGGGRCAPSPEQARVGAPCTTTIDCGTYGRDACNNEIGDGYPGGYCALEPCDDVQVCPMGATCVAMPFETPACLQSCLVDSDCRMAEGYVCQLFPTTPPIGFGPSDHACGFACTADAECTAPLTCNLATGKCIP